MARKVIPIAAGVVMLVGAGAFYGGMKYASAKSPMRFFQRGTGNIVTMVGPGGQTFRGGLAGAGGFVTGEVLSNDGKTLTVKSHEGGSKIILLSDATEVSRFVAGQASDLGVGTSVTIQGKSNSDGSLTAQSIQARPVGSAQFPPSANRVQQ